MLQRDFPPRAPTQLEELQSPPEITNHRSFNPQSHIIKHSHDTGVDDMATAAWGYYASLKPKSNGRAFILNQPSQRTASYSVWQAERKKMQLSWITEVRVGESALKSNVRMMGSRGCWKQAEGGCLLLRFIYNPAVKNTSNTHFPLCACGWVCVASYTDKLHAPLLPWQPPPSDLDPDNATWDDWRHCTGRKEEK